MYKLVRLRVLHAEGTLVEQLELRQVWATGYFAPGALASYQEPKWYRPGVFLGAFHLCHLVKMAGTVVRLTRGVLVCSTLELPCPGSDETSNREHHTRPGEPQITRPTSGAHRPLA